jgi:hypothetical protein
MATRDELTAEERLILVFVEAEFRKRGMMLALAMVQDPDFKLIDLRTLVGRYRERWQGKSTSPPLRSGSWRRWTPEE